MQPENTVQEDTTVGNTVPNIVPDAQDDRVVGFDIEEKEQLGKKEDAGIPVEIKDERGRPVYQADRKTPITISVVGSLSKRYRAVQALSRGRVLRSAGKDDRETETDEQLGLRNLREQTEAVAACITGWSTGFTVRGQPFEFNKANAVRLLTANPHIQSQLEVAMNDHARFFGASSNGSKP